MNKPKRKLLTMLILFIIWLSYSILSVLLASVGCYLIAKGLINYFTIEYKVSNELIHGCILIIASYALEYQVKWINDDSKNW